RYSPPWVPLMPNTPHMNNRLDDHTPQDDNNFQPDTGSDQEPLKAQPTPPIFNLPGVIVMLAGVMAAVHALVTWGLSDQGFTTALLLFSFIPATVTQTFPDVPSAWVAVWTPVTHAFLHGDWLHLGVNVVWLAAFGSVVAKRLGPLLFLIFFALGSASGALAHLLSHGAAMVPVVGASGAVSACMGAAVRFAFTRAGVSRHPETARRLSLIESFQNPAIVAFVAIWFAMNWVFGSGVIAIPGAEGAIAWEAHVGGFLFGLLGFGLFDLLRPKRLRFS
ncbi:MAG: rhomboid family intramembrane serine protease, partial [Pseudomonadota bacterium]